MTIIITFGRYIPIAHDYCVVILGFQMRLCYYSMNSYSHLICSMKISRMIENMMSIGAKSFTDVSPAE